MPRNGGMITAQTMVVWAANAEARGQLTDAQRLLDMAIREEGR